MKASFILGLSFLLTSIPTNAQDGSLVWFKSYGGLESDGAMSIVETIDSGYMIVGDSESFITIPGPYGEYPIPVIWLLKTDSNGDTLWTKIFNENNDIVHARKIKQTVEVEPNPFNPSTNIRIHNPDAGLFTVNIFSLNS